MRSTTAIVLVGALLLAAPAVSEEEADVASQLRAMQERMSQLEDRLEATSDELAEAHSRVEEQHKLIERSGLATESANASALASFLENVEMGGWISGSYVYNFEGHDSENLAGANSGPGVLPFKGDTNSFQLDQLWFELEKGVTEDSRAGFRADIVYGKTAGLLSGCAGCADGTLGDELELYQAYIQYLAPVFGGTTLKFGKFGTVIGAEVAGARDNFNITRGHVYNLFEPITHTGILASTDFGGGGSISLGLVNETRSFPAADIDLNNNKAVIWSLGWGWDTVSVSFAGAYGDSDSGQGTALGTRGTPSGDKEMILDFILSWDPNDAFSAYINADYIDSENSTDPTAEFDGYGIAVAGRYAVNDRLGLALRGEYATLESDAPQSLLVSSEELTLYGITGTVDYALTEDLLVRAELRYDSSDSSDTLFEDAFTNEEGLFREDDQFIGAVEVIYTF
ncbi:MAG: outer membrane beta-barrel protein [Myxococcales bacterium]|nr:outer membrane beta-barrel protein [Myxococcales bacterium]